MNIILFGPPGSGKGTQAQLLQERMGYKVISTGQMFRDVVELESDLGKKVKDILARGDLVQNDIVMEMVEQWIHKYRSDFIVFDGIPRTLYQKNKLEETLHKPSLIPVVFYLEVPLDNLLNRIHERNTIEHRNDDKENVFLDRIKIYNEQTKSLLDSFDVVHSIDGTLSKEIVFRSILNILTER